MYFLKVDYDKVKVYTINTRETNISTNTYLYKKKLQLINQQKKEIKWNHKNNSVNPKGRSRKKGNK